MRIRLWAGLETMCSFSEALLTRLDHPVMLFVLTELAPHFSAPVRLSETESMFLR